MTAAGAPRVSVLIVSYNTRDRLIECLTGLFASALPEMQVVVVDNDSADGSADVVSDAFPEVRLIRAERNVGFGRAVNMAAEVADDGYLLLLNPDTTVPPGSLKALVDFADRHPEYGIYGGRTLRPNGSLDPSSCWGAPSVWSLFCWALGLSTAFRRSALFDPESLGPWNRDTVREVPIVTGCLLLVPRQEFRRLNGFDPVYFLYGEDADFSFRARQLGLRPVIVPEAEIVHDNGGSTEGSGLKMAMVWAGRSTYLLTHWPHRRARAGILLLQAGAGLRVAVGSMIGRPSEKWVSVWRRRADWRDGYPTAERTLFGLQVAA